MNSSTGMVLGGAMAHEADEWGEQFIAELCHCWNDADARKALIRKAHGAAYDEGYRAGKQEEHSRAKRLVGQADGYIAAAVQRIKNTLCMNEGQ